MIHARPRALVLAGIALIAAGALVVHVASIARRRSLAHRPPGARPTLLLLTSLPLMFSENFSLRGRRLTGTRGAGNPLSRDSDQRHRRRRARQGAAAADGSAAGSDRGESGRPRSVGAPRRARAGPCRSDARMAERAAARRCASPAADVRGYRTSRALGPDGSRGPKRAGRRSGGSAGYDDQDRVAGRAVRRVARSAPTGSSPIAGSARAERRIVADADFIDPQDLGEGAEHNLDAMLSELSALAH